MKYAILVIAAPTPAAGQLLTAMDISAFWARMMDTNRLLGHVMVVPNAKSKTLMTGKTRRAHNELAITTTNTSYFAHGRSGAFLPRTRSLAQHDV